METILLINASANNEALLDMHYSAGINREYSVVTTYQGKGKKPNKATIVEWCNDYLDKLLDEGMKTLIVCDAEYFKALSKKTNTSECIGYTFEYTHNGRTFTYLYCPNYQGIFYNPEVKDNIDLALSALSKQFVSDIIHTAHYYTNNQYSEVREALQELSTYPELSVDIETFSLKHYEAGIATICFCIDQHNGIAFAVDYEPVSTLSTDGFYGKQIKNQKMYDILREFFNGYTGKLLFHGGTFDIKCLVYALYMRHLNDIEYMNIGINVLTKNMDDTKIIAYLAKNSTTRPKLSLKSLAHKFTGKYAQEEISDVRKIPINTLLEYNLIDGLATFYVRNTLYPVLLQDNQEEVYLTIFKPTLKTIIGMELTGVCLDMDKVKKAKKELKRISIKTLRAIRDSKYTQGFMEYYRSVLHENDYTKRRDKAKNPDNIKYKELEFFDKHKFNPNSGTQLESFLYEYLELPVLDKTKNGNPATGAKTLTKLINHSKDAELVNLLNLLIDYSKASKILTTFIPAFMQAKQGTDGNYYMFGCFVLGGTVSGRLSSNSPNLQNTPSKGIYSKLIKECFIAPKGKLLGSSDFQALEDVVNTLLTRDPNKEKVLLHGYDPHMFRTVAYWPEHFKGKYRVAYEGDTAYRVTGLDGKDSYLLGSDTINVGGNNITVEDLQYKPEVVTLNKIPIEEFNAHEVNTLKSSEDEKRSASKNISFALQYLGTWATLVNNCGFSEEESKKIESNHHDLYSVSKQWVENKILEASKVGYSTVAFGLRIRTPMLSSVVYGSKSMPREAAKEARTLGNAVSGQSYGLLNCRAANEFMDRVQNSIHKDTITMCMQIHDAIYLYFPSDAETVKWINDNLIDCMRFQDLPELQHPSIKLSSEMDIHYPNWSKAITLPNGISADDIINICNNS